MRILLVGRLLMKKEGGKIRYKKWGKLTNLYEIFI